MPAFGDRLAADARWHLINYLRALSAGDAARLLGPVRRAPSRPGSSRPTSRSRWAPTYSRSLKDYRGRKIVLLVLYTLPTSHARLAELAEALRACSATLGVEIIAVPTDADPDAIRRLADGPPILYPVVTDGAPEILDTYRLFSPAPHAEFLIDRQGYLRAIAGRARRAPARRQPARWPRCSSSTTRRSRRRRPRSTCTDARRGGSSLLVEPRAGPRPGRRASCGGASRRAGSPRELADGARAAATAGGEREYRATGVVRAGLAELGILVITHGDIPGLHAAHDDGLPHGLAEDSGVGQAGRRGTIHVAGHATQPGDHRDRQDGALRAPGGAES